MAVGANTYGTVDRVTILLQSFLENGSIEQDSVLDPSEIETLLDDRAARLNMHLEAEGYVVPVVVGTNPTAHAALVSANSKGAALDALAIIPNMAIDPDGGVDNNALGASWQSEWDDMMSMIDGGKLQADKTAAITHDVPVMSSISRDSSGNLKKPFFTRTLHEFPGLRTATDDD